jgi:hypothetical protein
MVIVDRSFAAFAKPTVLTNIEALLWLYALADWRAIDPHPGPSWFRTYGLMTGVTNDNRGVSIRLARQRDCCAYGCDRSVAENSTGDHIVALAAGGPAGAENFIPLCGPCNSSKGDRDLLDWWDRKSWPFGALPHDVLVAYARLTYRNLQRCRRIRMEASLGLIGAVEELREGLPVDCTAVLEERVQWMAGTV